MPLRIITLFLLLLPALTQSQNLQWVRQAGGVYETTPNVIWDIGEKTNIGMDGFQYSTGTFYQIAQFDGITISAPNPSLQMYLVQYDSSGNVQWAKQSGGTNHDAGQYLVSDSSNNAYVCGYTSRIAQFDTFQYQFPAINVDYLFVAKYNASGQAQWVKGIYGIISFRGLTIDMEGNLYAAGSFVQTPIIDSISITSVGDNDIFLVKYGNDGQLLWVRQAGGSMTDRPWAMTGDAEGNTYLTGYVEDTCYFGTQMLIPTSAQDLFLASYDAQGNLRWLRQAGGSTAGNRTQGIDLALDGRGHLYLAGFVDGPPPFAFDSLSYPAEKPFLARYDTAGQIHWVQEMALPLRDYEMEADADGNLYFGGTLSQNASSVYGIDLMSAGGFDIYFNKYDSLGHLLWARRAGGKEFDGARGIALGPDARSLSLTGYFNTTANWESTGLTSYGGSDIFTARYTACSPTISRAATLPLCPGATTELYANTCPGIAHQWLRDGQSLTDATTHILATNQTGAYQVILYDDGIADTSRVYLLEAAPAPLAPVIMGDSTFCEGGYVILNGPLNALAWNWSNGHDFPFFYTDTALTLTLALIDSNGCETPPSAPFTVTELLAPPTPTISVLSGDSLACDVAAAHYIWLRDGLLLPDSTQVIPALQSGTYQVIIVEQGCPSDTSAAFVHIASRLDGLPPGASLHIWPQPAREVLHVRIEGLAGANIRLRLNDLSGKTLFLRQSGPDFELPTAGLSSGMYLLEVQAGAWRGVRKVMVW